MLIDIQHWSNENKRQTLHCVLVGLHKEKITTLHSACRDLTFAGLQAFEPRVFDITAASTVIEPSTARSTTTEFAGFLDGVTLRAYGADCRHCYRRDY